MKIKSNGIEIEFTAAEATSAIAALREYARVSAEDAPELPPAPPVEQPRPVEVGRGSRPLYRRKNDGLRMGLLRTMFRMGAPGPGRSVYSVEHIVSNVPFTESMCRQTLSNCKKDGLIELDREKGIVALTPKGETAAIWAAEHPEALKIASGVLA